MPRLTPEDQNTKNPVWSLRRCVVVSSPLPKGGGEQRRAQRARREEGDLHNDATTRREKSLFSIFHPGPQWILGAGMVPSFQSKKHPSPLNYPKPEPRLTPEDQNTKNPVWSLRRCVVVSSPPSERRGRTAKGAKGAKGRRGFTQRRDDATGEEAFFNIPSGTTVDPRRWDGPIVPVQKTPKPS